jgi:hypothetical protein
MFPGITARSWDTPGCSFPEGDTKCSVLCDFPTKEKRLQNAEPFSFREFLREANWLNADVPLHRWEQEPRRAAQVRKARTTRDIRLRQRTQFRRHDIRPHHRSMRAARAAETAKDEKAERSSAPKWALPEHEQALPLAD